MAKSTMRVILDVELASVGKTLTDLRNREGILNIHLDMEDGKKTPKPQAEPVAAPAAEQPRQMFGKALVAALTKLGPSSKDVLRAKLLAEFPKTSTQYSQTLNYLSKTGRVHHDKKSDQWSLTKKYHKALTKNGAAPVKAAKAGKPRPEKTNGGRKMPVTQRDKTGGELILEHIMQNGGKPASRADMEQWFVADGRSDRSVGDQLGKLVKAGKVTRVGDGTYALAGGA